MTYFKKSIRSPPYIDISQDNGHLQHSVLNSILPYAIQNRLPRRSLWRREAGYLKAESEQTENVPRSQRSESLEVDLVEPALVAPSPVLSRRSSSESTTVVASSDDGDCGLGSSRERTYAMHGINLLGTVISEAQEPDCKSNVLARQQYIHSLAYLLHGIPEDLSQHEKQTLEAALPKQLSAPPQPQHAVAVDRCSHDHSVVHRLFASGIIQIFLFIQILLPYLKIFLRSLYNFERSHHISERAVAAGMLAINNLGRKGSEAFAMMMRNENSRTVQLVAAILIWWVQEISNGIQDGMEGCVEIVDQGKSQGMKFKIES